MPWPLDPRCTDHVHVRHLGTSAITTAVSTHLDLAFAPLKMFPLPTAVLALVPLQLGVMRRTSCHRSCDELERGYCP
jgi:hypothetical protein